MDAAEAVLVLGIGNPLCGDDGFGVEAVAALSATFELPDNVVVIDGGTQGIYLLPHLQAAKRVLLFDAVDIGHEPGGMVVMEHGALPSFVAQGKMSGHQGGVSELLALAGLGGWEPAAVAMVGSQVGSVALGAPMSSAVGGGIAAAVEMGVAILADWGVACRARPQPLPRSAPQWT